MKKISRRKFLFIGLAAFVSAAVVSISFLSFDRVVFYIIKNDLSFLSVKDEQIEKFIKDARKQNHWNNKFFNWKKQLFVRLSYLVSSVWTNFPYAYKYRQYRSEIVGDFLLSTDFFMNKMDEDQALNYIALYHPYKRACSNPFSNLYYPHS